MNERISSRIMKSIDDYVKGRLSPSEVDRLWVDLLQYPEYYPLLRTEAALKKRVDRKEDMRSVRGGTRPWSYKRNTWIYALSAIILLAMLTHLYQSQVAPDLPTAIDEIEVIHLISPEVTRSGSEAANEIDEGLNHAFLLSVSGKTEAAIQQYQSLSGETDYRDVVNYNLAILYFNLERYSLSVSYFEQTNCHNFEESQQIESCLWFKTNSYLAIEDINMAEAMAIQTRDMDGYFRAEASSVLGKIQN